MRTRGFGLPVKQAIRSSCYVTSAASWTAFDVAAYTLELFFSCTLPCRSLPSQLLPGPRADPPFLCFFTFPLYRVHLPPEAPWPCLINLLRNYPTTWPGLCHRSPNNEPPLSAVSPLRNRFATLWPNYPFSRPFGRPGHTVAVACPVQATAVAATIPLCTGKEQFECEREGGIER